MNTLLGSSNTQLSLLIFYFCMGLLVDKDGNRYQNLIKWLSIIFCAILLSFKSHDISCAVALIMGFLSNLKILKELKNLVYSRRNKEKIYDSKE